MNNNAKMRFQESIVSFLVFIFLLISLNFYPFKIVIGYLLIFFIPGYLLLPNIFRRDELNEIEVIGFSFGLSACLSGFGGLLLYHLWEISTLSIIAYLTSLSIILLIVGYTRNNIFWKPTSSLKKILTRFSPIFFLCLFVFIIAFLPYTSYDTLKSSGDVRCYLSVTQKIINGLPPTEMEYLARPGINGYFFEVLFAMLHFTTGLSTITLYQIGSGLYIFILPMAFYILGKALSNDHRVGILSAFICTLINPEFVFWYVFTKPLVFSLIPFSLFIALMVKTLDETVCRRKMFITGLMLAMTITTHPNTGLASVFFIFFYIALSIVFNISNINGVDKLKIILYKILVISVLGIFISVIFSWPILSYLISTHIPQTNLYRPVHIDTNSYESLFLDGFLFPFSYEFSFGGGFDIIHPHIRGYKIISILSLIGLLYSIRYKRSILLSSLLLSSYLLTIHDILKLEIIFLPLPPRRMVGYLILIMGVFSSIALVRVILPWINVSLKSRKPLLKSIIILSILLLILIPYAYDVYRLSYYFFSRGLTLFDDPPFFSKTKIIVADLVSRNTEYDSIILSDENIQFISCLPGRRIAWSLKYVHKLDTQDIVLDAGKQKRDSDIIFDSRDINVVLPKLKKHHVSHILTRLNNPIFFNSTYFSIKGQEEGYTLFEVLYP